MLNKKHINSPIKQLKIKSNKTLNSQTVQPTINNSKKMSKTLQEKLTHGISLKEQGNARFTATDYQGALHYYHEAILFIKGLDSEPIMGLSTQPKQLTPETKLNIKTTMISILNNMTGWF